MSLLLVVPWDLWSIIGDSGFVVSSIGSSALVSFSFHILTGKMGTRPSFGRGFIKGHKVWNLRRKHGNVVLHKHGTQLCAIRTGFGRYLGIHHLD
jgi:hypothetical protein